MKFMDDDDDENKHENAGNAKPYSAILNKPPTGSDAQMAVGLGLFQGGG